MLFLNDGNDIPQIGVASFRTDSLDQTRKLIHTHIDNGIRHFEIAELFGNGHVIIDAYNTHPRMCPSITGEPAQFSRKDMFVTLKLWPKGRRPAELIECCRETLEFSGLTYADLVLVHAPIEINNRFEQWKALEGT
jgi:diketogulonate reductase-like aldo/keto reductase